MTVYYSGIGSRQTPTTWLDYMRVLATKLAKRGYVLRSGAAAGADTAFEKGCLEVDGPKEIYLPWAKFEGRPTNENGYYYTKDLDEEAYYRAKALAERFHPAWGSCSEGAKKLHTRNVHQVLGLDVRTPSKFVVCWTATDHGGTLQAVRVAEYMEIPVFNLALDGTSEKLLEYLKTL